VARDDTATTTQHKPVDIDVLSNDADPEGGTLAVPVTITAPPTHGNANPSASGPVHYVPFDKYVGTDSFVYQVCDAGGSCSTATVNIAVNP